MRLLLPLLAAGLVTAASAQPESNWYPTTVDAISVSLPGSFRYTPATEPEPGMRLQLFMDADSDRMVVVTTNRSLSWLQRWRFKRGRGVPGSNDGATYERVAAPALHPTLAPSVGSAFRAVGTRDDERAGTLVRGCRGDLCFEITVVGPVLDTSAEATPHADLLAGIRLLERRPSTAR